MELRTMRYFLAVAREENMTRAAELLHVTQPTLSKQLKALEDELGKKLFTRHSFSIQLSEEGVLLRKRAEDLIKMADKITTEFLAWMMFWEGMFTSVWRNLTRSDASPPQSEDSKSLTLICIIILPAATRNRLQKNSIKVSLTLPYWRRNPILQNIII